MTDIPTFARIGDDALAPGSDPGVSPTWASSDKDFVTTSLGAGGLGGSRLWATLGHGVLNEVYWPSTGEPQVRDVTFYLIGVPDEQSESRPEGEGTTGTVKSDGAGAQCRGENGFTGQGWVDLKRAAGYSLSVPAPHLPLPTVTHSGTHAGADYRLTLEVLPDPQRDALLIRYALDGPFRLVVIAAPHLNGTGQNNVAWVDGALFAHHEDHVLCLSATGPLRRASAGVVGTSDGWQDLQANGRLTWAYTRAGPGNVALSAELEDASGTLALGFSNTARGAWTLARGALAEGYEAAEQDFLRGWSTWADALKLPAPDPTLGHLALLSAAVLKMHEDHTYPGAIVASLSVPWGDSTDTLGGYHLVWPRDATLAAFALIAAGAAGDARRILARFLATQQADGHWPQNNYPSGDPFWNGLQLDETAFPVLLAAKLREEGVPELPGTAEMVGRALGFVVRTGPTSDQDRWEENPGVNPFTLAVAIAALVAGAAWLPEAEREDALKVADEWNERLESWCYVEGTPLARELEVAGYYVRLAPPQRDGGLGGTVLLRNRMGETIGASALVSLDFSYLTRLGLRQASDPRIVGTLKVVDRVLRVSTPSGDLYHRYNDDGYGEHEDGRPFDGSGIGRLWPLLSGERGHLALQSGEDPLPYLRTIANCASPGGLLPEQVWDAAPIPERGLYPGRPSGSAMPLVWTHAEFLKLLLARETGRPAELLRVVQDRYAHTATGQPRDAAEWRWRNETPLRQLPPGRDLTFESPVPFTLHYGWDGWQDVQERRAQCGTFGLWLLTFRAGELRGHGTLNFTRRFAEGWEGSDHEIRLEQGAATQVTADQPEAARS